MYILGRRLASSLIRISFFRGHFGMMTWLKLTSKGKCKKVPLVILAFFLSHPVSGSTITAEIQGVIDACVKLTGMPDLTLSFMVKSWARDLVLGKLDASGKTERREGTEPEGMVRASHNAHGRPRMSGVTTECVHVCS